MINKFFVQSYYSKFAILLLSFLLLSTFENNAQSNCSDNEVEVIIDIAVDNYPQEVAWYLNYNETDTIYSLVFKFDTLFNKYIYDIAAEGGYVADTIVLADMPAHYMLSDTFCIAKDACLLFGIMDSEGDGACCNPTGTDGFYKIRVNGELIAMGDKYGLGDEFIFNCGIGKDCFEAFPIEEGVHIAESLDVWYEFTPDSQAVYQIETCFPSNNCDTKIWVYYRCIGLKWDENVTSSISFQSGGCEDNDSLTVLAANLIKDQTYYIRIGDNFNTCEGQQIEWSIFYKEKVIGCMDATACNYNPVATVASDCIYPGDPNCPAGPDLIVDTERAKQTMFIDYEDLSHFDEFECFIDEGCVSGYGVRELLKFDTKIDNIGDADYFIGTVPEEEDLVYPWEWSPCHNHAHFGGFMEYLMFDEQGSRIPFGSKQGVCLLDHQCDLGVKKFSCGYQGISAGCSDIYPVSDGQSNWECQWLDLTGFPTGIYTLVLRANWKNDPDGAGRVETNYSNNWSQICLEFTRDEEDSLKFTILEECNNYVDCTGEIFGSALIDCEGNCDGSALRGDINKDGILDIQDTENYAFTSLDEEAEATLCNDLNDDGIINVYDAVLENYCYRSTEVTIPNNDYWCTFPYALFNPTDSITLTLSELNLEEKYAQIDIQVISSGLVGFQFSMDGLNIDSLELLQNNDAFIVMESEGEIIGVSQTGEMIAKNSDFSPFFKIYFTPDSTKLNNICLNEFKTAINDLRQEVLVGITNSCKSYEIDPDMIVIINDTIQVINDSLLVINNDTLIVSNDTILVFNDTLPIFGDTTFVVTDSIFIFSDTAFASNDTTLLFDTVGLNLEYITSNQMAKVFPNPFHEKTTFQLNENNDFPISLSIANTEGKVIFNKQIQEKNFIFYKDSLESGMYFYTLSNKNNKESGKLIVF